MADAPLAGYRVVEFATVGGIPLCGLILAQMGAEVVQIRNPAMPELGVPVPEHADMGRWRRQVIEIDVKQAAGHADAARLAGQADVLIEGFRPGVMERLGLGPDTLRARHPGLIYGRLTGWGQHGPWAARAGHDINFVAMSGALHAMGPVDGPPAVPLNLVGDLAGGALYLALAINAALLQRERGGTGGVIDAAMTDGALHMLSGIYGRLAAGIWTDQPASNVIDGGVPWYRCYRCADGGWIAVGAIEERFYNIFVGALGIPLRTLPPRADKARWPELEQLFARQFASQPRRHWEAVYAPLDACVTPVLTLAEAPAHPQHLQRQRFEDMGRGVFAPGWFWNADAE
ncbi:CaiB/BaiF CoA transferase family protein [Achromobacter marplatensis]|uniref:CaiB/BaiF CoA transferase family protein n=1 Tax=Achromobacter marplatensis TaxID=470868 RepID=UPI0039F71672